MRRTRPRLVSSRSLPRRPTLAVLVLAAALPALAQSPLDVAEQLLAEGRLDEAQSAAEPFVDAADPSVAARAGLVVGQAEGSRHRPEEALVHLRAAAALAAFAGDDAVRRRAIEQIGLQALVTGRPGLAVESFRTAMELVDTTGEESARARSHALLGLALQKVGQHEAALERYTRAAALYGERGIVVGQIGMMQNAGTVEAEWLGRFDEAVRRFEEAARLAEGRDDVPDEVRGLLHLNVAEAHADAGRTGEGMRHVRTATKIFETIGHRPYLSRAAATESKIHLLDGRPAPAEAAARRAVDLGARIGDLEVLRLAHLRLGRSLSALGRDTEALEQFGAAADALERLRRDVGVEEMQISFLRDKRETYEAWIEHLYRLHAADNEGRWAEAAWRASEASRSRSFIDHLPGRHADPPDEPARVEQARALAGRTGRVIEYFFGDDRVYRLDVDAGGVSFSDLGPAADLSDRIAFFSADLRSGEGDGSATDAAARAVRDLVLGDLPALDGPVVVIPDGPLHTVPFSLLLGPTPVSYAPSVVALSRMRRDRDPEASSGTLAVGVSEADAPGLRLPALPLAGREAELAASFRRPPGHVLTGRVSEPEVRGLLRETWDVVHFATHAWIDPEDAGRSGLLLGAREDPGATGDEDDALLSAREVAQMTVAARLVVLSGCTTAGDETSPGEGMLGLGRSFLRAGAGALLVTLWDVSDHTAYEVSRRFYTEAARDLPVNHALANAQRALSSLPDVHAFAVIGDGTIVLEGLEAPRDGTRLAASLGLVALGSVLGWLAWRVRSRGPGSG